ncbi:MAG: bifunctional folylpolyglutamate synthase/dihydrofolate synthase [bacterium]|nr:bifunctional folylpolyglutamate synthase/dihydrofolate synthase [bacterium]
MTNRLPATPREFLLSLLMHGMKLGLDNIRFLTERAGHPELQFPIVHVGGTNGKGSAVAMVAAMLAAAGYRVGRFTSPHLIDVNERFLIDGHPIDDESLDRHIRFVQDVTAEMDHPPTYFEATTLIALRHFAETGVDAVCLEVGMGGRFDSTNIVHPEVCAITNIDLEHTKYLGDTLEAIAFEKAGILKAGVPAVVTERRPGPRDVIIKRAAEVGAPVGVIDRDFRFDLTKDDNGFIRTYRLSYDSATLRLRDVPLGLRGAHQGDNAATAVAVAERLRDRFPRLTDDAIAAGLRDARWPCRLEQVIDDPPVIVDVAHNPAGARRLPAELPPCVVVLAVSSDKDAVEMIEALAPITDKLILSQCDCARRMPLEDLCSAAEGCDYEQRERLEDAIGLGLQYALADLPLLICGSIFTAGEARTILSERFGAPSPRF